MTSPAGSPRAPHRGVRGLPIPILLPPLDLLAESGAGVTVALMTALHVWHLWAARHWPASVREEAQFVDDLDALAATATPAPEPTETATDPAEVRRAHRVNVTAVLNALRCGLTAEELMSNLPGADPAELAAAYRTLDESRRAAVTAWQNLVAEQTWHAVQEHGVHAAVLMPVPVHRILTIATNTQGRSLTSAVQAMAGTVREHGRMVARAERALERLAAAPAQAVALGTRLHNPADPGLWGSPFFLPPRVTSLSAPRVADLLGERETHGREPRD